MSYCLPKFYTDKFIDALKTGKIDPAKLSSLSSIERNKFFESIVGKDNASSVNALFESKLLLKNQKAGLINWAKKTAGLNEKKRTDLISRINKMEKALDAKDVDSFLKDLASQKLGTEVTFQESKKIVEMTKKIEDLKSSIKENDPLGSKERLDYGLELALLRNYISELKIKNDIVSLKDLRDPVKAFEELNGIVKSIQSTMDNSFFGRQGIKVLLDPKTSGIWIKNFIKSFGDITKELRGKDAMLPTQAEVYSRPNALNGKYEAMKLDIGLKSEEAYPSSIPSRIPVLGRVFKASESAYNSAALRMRADIADMMIKSAEGNGINILRDSMETRALGSLINSLTGRGNLGTAEVLAKKANLYVYSLKFLKSNVDTLLSPVKLGLDILKGEQVSYARKQSAYSTLRIIASISAIMTVSNALNPGSVDLDPRGPHFGKLKIGNRWFDITGGMAALVTLASRVTPSYHNGKFGIWAKNSKGKYQDLTSGKFGSLTPVDYMTQFAQGKLAPLISTILTVLKQKDYQGKKPTIKSVTKNLVTPLPIQTFEKVMDDPTGEVLKTMILESIGLSSSK